ncbi:MAG: hypothetical protein ACKOA0_16060, partial [Burkholderiaceae bacterium]
MKPLHLLTFPTLLAVVLLLGACDKKEAQSTKGADAAAAKAAAKPADPMLVELSPEMTKAFRVEPATMSDIAVE